MSLFARIIFVFAALATGTSQAATKIQWRAASRPYLEARSTEDESDAAVRASCAFEGMVQLRLGADYGVGKGKGEPVSVKIEGDGRSAKVQGVSRNSPDFEMTGGAELVTDLPLDDPAVDILFSGKAVTLVTPDQKKHPLVDADAVGATKNFLKKCRGS